MHLRKRGILFVSVFIFVALSSAGIFTDSSSSNFNNGTYFGTTHNGTGIILNGSELSGSYVSRIFDAGSDSVMWNNLTIFKNSPNDSLLISVDVQSSVWNSTNRGVNWSLVNSDYTGPDGNGADDISANNTNSIFILNSPAIWVSDNRGSNWTKVNTDFNPGSSSSGLAMTISHNNTIFVADGSQAIWSSYDSGISFTKVNVSFNSGGQNPSKMVSNLSNAIFVVDTGSKVWYSINEGYNWIKSNDDFNGAGITNVGAKDMKINSSGAIYIADRQKLWVSIDSGFNWNNVNDDFNGGGVSANAFSMIIDENNSIYLIDGNEDVYLSTNQGVNFTKIASNINGGNTGMRNSYNLFSNSSISYQVRNCTASCTGESYLGPDGTSNSYYLTSNYSLNLTGRYLQYKLYFGRKDSNVVPILNNITIGYSLTNTPPNVSIVYPLPGNYSAIQTTINYSVIDSDVQACWYSLNNGVTNNTISCGTNITGLNSGQGTSTWTVYSNDTAGLIGYSNITFFVDSIPPYVYFNELSPISGFATNNNSISLGADSNDTNFANITITLFNSTSIIFSNTSISRSFNITYTGLSDDTYFYNFSSRDILNNYNSTTNRNFSIDTTAPELAIISPSEGSAYGYNISIALNYTLNEKNRDSCWYRFDSDVANIILPNCQNTTFNISNGNHVVYLFANDTLGNIALEYNSFFVQVDAPSITLNSPSGSSYINHSNNISLNYTPSDFDLDSCSLLLGSLGSSLQTNQTTSSPLNDSMNSFLVNLADGSYSWAISCNDTSGHNATTGNSTFYVDTKNPLVTIISPQGTYSSVNNIPLSLNYTDASPVKCRYNVTFASTGNVVIGNSELFNCESTTFNVDTDASYFLWMSVNDSAGNVNNSRSSFTVSSNSNTGGPGGSSRGGGGGGGSLIGFAPYNLAIDDPGQLKIGRGKSEAVELKVSNRGIKFLNDCYFIPSGGISQWISGSDIYSLGPGQTTSYIFNVNAPIDSEVGDYFATLNIMCNEINSSLSYHVSVTGGEFELNILESRRIGTRLSAKYTIENFANEAKNLTVNYKLLNNKGELLVEGSFDSLQVPANEKLDSLGEFELPKNSIGDYTLIMEVSDGFDSSQKQQKIRLASEGISGFVISEGNLRTVTWFGIIVALSFGVFLVAKVLIKQAAIKRVASNNRNFIAIEPN